MNKSVFFLAFLITVSFCSGARAVSYDAIIDNLVELNKAAGKDKNDVGLLVSQVSQSTKDTFDKFSGFIGQINDGCTQGGRLLESFLKKLEADKISLNASINSANTHNQQIVVERTKLAANLKITEADLAETEKSIDKELHNYEVYGAEAEQKLAVVKSLKDIITDELLGAQRGRAFVQLETFNDKLHELKDLLSKSQDGIYGPLVTTLLSLAEGKGFSDQKVLAQIMGVLNKLEGNLVHFRQLQEKESKQNLKNLKTKATEQGKQIRALAGMVAQLNSDFSNNESIVKFANVDLVTLAAEVKRKSDELNYWKGVCIYEEKYSAETNVTANALQGKLKGVTNALIQ
jgi:chromosome segregation ATPase